MPWLADLARLERAWLDAYHAADTAPLEAGALAALGPDALAGAGFKPHPAAALVASQWAIHDLFEQGRAGTASASPTGGQACLVTRPALSVEVRLLPAGGAAFFSSILSGAALGRAISDALAQHERFDIAAGLHALIVSGAAASLNSEQPA